MRLIKILEELTVTYRNTFILLAVFIINGIWSHFYV